MHVRVSRRRNRNGTKVSRNLKMGGCCGRRWATVSKTGLTLVQICGIWAEHVLPHGHSLNSSGPSTAAPPVLFFFGGLACGRLRRLPGWRTVVAVHSERVGRIGPHSGQALWCCSAAIFDLGLPGSPRYLPGSAWEKKAAGQANTFTCLRTGCGRNGH